MVVAQDPRRPTANVTPPGVEAPVPIDRHPTAGGGGGGAAPGPGQGGGRGGRNTISNPYIGGLWEQSQAPDTPEWQNYHQALMQGMLGQGPYAFDYSPQSGSMDYIQMLLHGGGGANPFLEEIIAQTRRDAGRDFAGQQGLANLRMASGSGGIGSQAGVQEGMARAFGEGLSGVTSGLRYSDFNRQAGERMQAAQLGQQADLAGEQMATQRYGIDRDAMLGLLGEQGAMSRAKLGAAGTAAGLYSGDRRAELDARTRLQSARISAEPALMNADWNRFTYLNEWPWRQLGFYGDLVNSFGAGLGGTMSSGYGTTLPGGSPWASALMGGLGGYRLGQSMAPPSYPTGDVQ